MLTHTFRHIQGIGEKTEVRLWDAGLTTWNDFLDHPNRSRLPQWKQDSSCYELERSLVAIEKGDIRYFAARLPHLLLWRLFPEFSERVAYLDIETTGLGREHSIITVVGIYDGVRARSYVSGRNLEEFAGDIDGFSLLVTYNGKQFDVPFLRDKLGIALDQAHIDLRFPLAALGYRGGLKKIERSLGLEREGMISNLDGWCAVLLWQQYELGEEGALETLLYYNAEDVIHLPSLLETVYNSFIEAVPFHVNEVKMPPPATVPYSYDESIIRRVIGQVGR